MKSPCPALFTLSATAWSAATLLAVEIDPGFQVEVSGTVHALAIGPNGQIVAGGEFSAVNGAARANLAQLQTNGAIDETFLGEPDGAVLSVAFADDGSLYCGGAFNAPTRHIARFDGQGSLDTNFSLGASTSSRVDCLAVQTDGGAIVGGPFRRVDGTPRPYAARVNALGAFDSGFAPHFQTSFALEAGADALAVQADGKILVGGYLTSGDRNVSLVRMHSDGSLDAAFTGEHGPILYAKAILPLEDGRILIAGVANSSGEGFVRRLQADGSVDPTFAEASFEGAVEAIVLDDAGGVVAGGDFTGKLARLQANGVRDTEWGITCDGTVKALVSDPQGRIFVGGAFGKIGGLPQRGLARLVPSKSRTALTATNANGRFMAKFSGEAGRSYEIEASTDFQTWTTIGSTIATESGVEISDGTVTSRKHRFFRLKVAE